VCGPFGSSVCRCPPSDWRTPPLIERTNLLLRATADEYTLHFVDTAPLLAPMWDHAPDWVRAHGSPNRHPPLSCTHTGLHTSAELTLSPLCYPATM
jgi:hypothetical protein